MFESDGKFNKERDQIEARHQQILLGHREVIDPRKMQVATCARCWQTDWSTMKIDGSGIEMVHVGRNATSRTWPIHEGPGPAPVSNNGQECRCACHSLLAAYGSAEKMTGSSYFSLCADNNRSGCVQIWSRVDWSHCPICHRTFASIESSDEHRADGRCKTDEELLELGLWLFESPYSFNLVWTHAGWKGTARERRTRTTA